MMSTTATITPTTTTTTNEDVSITTTTTIESSATPEGKGNEIGTETTTAKECFYNIEDIEDHGSPLMSWEEEAQPIAFDDNDISLLISRKEPPCYSSSVSSSFDYTKDHKDVNNNNNDRKILEESEEDENEPTEPHSEDDDYATENLLKKRKCITSTTMTIDENEGKKYKRDDEENHPCKFTTRQRINPLSPELLSFDEEHCNSGW